MIIRICVAIAAGLLAAWPAGAHVLLDGKEAAVGADYKAVFVVPHGCAGSATVKLRVQIPEGVIVAQAEPKTGWALLGAIVETQTPTFFKMTGPEKTVLAARGDFDKFVDGFKAK